MFSKMIKNFTVNHQIKNFTVEPSAELCANHGQKIKQEINDIS